MEKCPSASKCHFCLRSTTKSLQTPDFIKPTSSSVQFEGIDELTSVLGRILNTGNGSTNLEKICNRCNSEYRQIYTTMYRYSKFMLPPTKEALVQVKKLPITTDSKALVLRSTHIANNRRNESRKDKLSSNASFEDSNFKIPSKAENSEKLPTIKQAVVRLKRLKMVSVNTVKIEPDDDSLNAYRSFENDATVNSFEDSRIKKCPKNTTFNYENLETHRSSFKGAKISKNFTEIITSDDKEAKIYSCNLCNAKYKSSTGFYYHFRAIHRKVSMKCDQCDASFTRMYRLKLHLKKHRDQIFHCSRCNLKFTTLDGIRNHELTHAENDLKCNQCNKVFINSRNLKIHQEIHSGEVFECDLCNKKFHCRRYWYRHKRKYQDSCLEAAVRANFIKTNGTVPITILNDSITEPNSNRANRNESNLSGKLEISNIDRQSVENTRAGRKENATVAGETFDSDKCDEKFISFAPVKEATSTNMTITNGTFNRTYDCQTCEAKYTTESNLFDHNRIDCKTTQFKCEQCTASFKFRFQLRQHLKIHTGEVFNCDKCDQKFISFARLQYHRYTHTEEKLKCDKCYKEFNNLLNFIRHKKTHSEKTLECAVCSELFTTKRNLWGHKRKHHTGETFDCDKCDQKFISFARLEHHRYTHIEEKLKCERCNKEFNNMVNFIRHKKIHSEKTLESDDCSEKFTTNRNRWLDTRKYHINLFKLLKCCVCGNCFPTMESGFKQMVRNNTVNNFKCQKCRLKRHVSANSRETRHSNDNIAKECDEKPKKCRIQASNKTYNCNECDAKYATVSGLKTHKRIHCNSLFKCNKCNAAFLCRTRLNRHIKIHTGETFDCDRCNLKFISYARLEYHRYTHTDAKLKCDQCNKEFKNSRNFKLHQQIHAEMRLECDHCDRKFSTNRYLWTHKRKNHAEHVKCIRCGDFYPMYVPNLKRRKQVQSNETHYCNKCRKIKENRNSVSIKQEFF